MSDAEAIPSTGLPTFDTELRKLLSLDPDIVRKAIAESGDDFRKLVEQIGDAPFRVAFALRDDSFCRRISRTNPAELTPLLNRARETVNALFGHILDDRDKQEQLMYEIGPGDTGVD